jgi:hypothetical protein
MYPRMALQLNTSPRSYGFYKKISSGPRPGCASGMRRQCHSTYDLYDAGRRRQRLAERCAITTAASAPIRRPIDFVAVRNLITMATVLQLLGFRAKSTNGGQLRGACPLHGSTSGTSRCFSANVDDHVYGCFKCGRVGNALDLWAAATKQPPHDAAIDLCGRLNVSVPYLPLEAPRHREEEPVTTTEQKTSNVGDVPPILYPLTRHQASSISR